jgi:Glycosyltransferase family 87
MSTSPDTEAIAAKPVAPYYVKALAMGLTAFLIGIHLWTWVFMLPTFLGGRADFRQLYTAGYMIRSGHAHELYDYDAQLHFQRLLVSPGDIALPFNHLAYESLLYAPFSLLNYRRAYFAFLALNVSLLALSFRLLRPRMNNLGDIGTWLPVAMLASFLPIAAALLQGQDSILLLTLAVAALVSLERGRQLTAGLLIGLGLFKFQVTIPIALLFLAWRRWRFSSGFLLSAIAAATLSAWMVGVGQLKVYAGALLAMSVRLSSVADQFRYGISPAAMPNLRGMIFGLTSGRLSTLSVQAVSIAASALALLLAATMTSAKQRDAELLLTATTASVLASYHLLIHDLSILFPTVAITLNRYLPAEATGDKKGRAPARTAAVMFVAPMCFSYSANHFYLVALPVLALLYVLVAFGFRSEEIEN